jgi:IS66 C-terminal element
MYTLIETARLNDVDPEAWFADVIARIADHPINPDQLLPWNWSPIPSRAKSRLISPARSSHHAYGKFVQTTGPTACSVSPEEGLRLVKAFLRISSPGPPAGRP